MLGEKGDEAVIRDYTYIKAGRYDWHLAKPLKGQTLAAHRKWIDVWQLIEVADMHYFPLWEKDVHDCLQARFSDLTSIFSHYCKSIGGSTTAEDAVDIQKPPTATGKAAAPVAMPKPTAMPKFIPASSNAADDKKDPGGWSSAHLPPTR